MPKRRRVIPRPIVVQPDNPSIQQRLLPPFAKKHTQLGGASEVANSGSAVGVTAVSTIRRFLLVLVTAAGLAALWIAGPAAAAGSPAVTTIVRPISFAEHFDAACGLPGSTEYWSGTERYHAVEFADGSVNITWGASFKVHQVSDDPTVAPRDRQGTDANVFHLSDNGPVVFHESFHDRNTDWGDIFLTTTFVEVNGEVQVDHTLTRNLPPDGC